MPLKKAGSSARLFGRIFCLGRRMRKKGIEKVCVCGVHLYLWGPIYEGLCYTSVIKQCALDRDLDLFEAGDETEVGERGLTLRYVKKIR